MQALEALQRLSIRSAAVEGSEKPSLDTKAEPPGPTAQSPEPQRMGERICGDAAWMQGAGERLDALLQKIFPALCTHPRPSVRLAAAHGTLNAKPHRNLKHKTCPPEPYLPSLLSVHQPVPIILSRSCLGNSQPGILIV